MNQSDSRQRTGSSRSRSSQAGSRRSREVSGSRRSSGSRSGQAYRSGSASYRGTNRRRKKPHYGAGKIALGVLILAVTVGCIFAAVKFIGSRQASGKETETTTEAETELQKTVTVDGVSITGMSRDDAKAALTEKYEWGMRITYQDQEYEVQNILGDRIDELLEEIYTGEAKEEGAEESYSLDTSGLEEKLKEEAAAVAALWDVPAKNGSISGFDKENGQFVYSGEQTGKVINQEKLVSDMGELLEARNFKGTVQALAQEVAPEISEAQAKEMYKVLGTYTTTTTSNKDRNTNIRLAADSLNGLILQPGEEFSFNKTTGERSQAKGYKPAGAYLNGELIEEPGGGVCQVSSTLYNAVVFAGLTTTERHAHSYEPSYVTPGEDAMVSYGGPDMKFVNNSPSAIAIRTNFADRKLKISIVGIPILEEGVELSMSSKKTAELDPPAPVYEEDQTLQAGQEVTVKQPVKGSRWVTNLITKKNGAEVSNEFFHNSTYRGKSATIKRNTSGVVISASSEASAESSTEPSGESETAPEGGNGPSPSSPSNQEYGPGITTSAATEPAPQPDTQASPQPQPSGPSEQQGPSEPPAPPAEAPATVAPNPAGQAEGQ